MIDEARTERIRRLRCMGFSIIGIAKQTGLSETEVAHVLKEPHLLAQASRGVGKSVSAKG